MKYTLRQESIVAFLVENANAQVSQHERLRINKEIFIKKTSDFGKKLKQGDDVIIELPAQIGSDINVKMTCTMHAAYKACNYDDYSMKLTLIDVKVSGIVME